MSLVIKTAPRPRQGASPHEINEWNIAAPVSDGKKSEQVSLIASPTAPNISCG